MNTDDKKKGEKTVKQTCMTFPLCRSDISLALAQSLSPKLPQPTRRTAGA